jgi:hypothetical protein
MCGRYASFLPAEAIARIFGTVNPLPNEAIKTVPKDLRGNNCLRSFAIGCPDPRGGGACPFHGRIGWRRG